MHDPITQVFVSMEVGDSFYLEFGTSKHSLRSNILTKAKKVGVKLKSRSEGNGVRFWKV